jgi:hypothetical protein
VSNLQDQLYRYEYVTGSNSSGHLCIDENQTKTFTKSYLTNVIDIPITKIKCGTNHLMILLENNSMVSIGDNTYGQLGWNIIDEKVTSPIFNELSEKVTKMKCNKTSTLILTSENNLWITGKSAIVNNSKHFSRISSPTKSWIKKIALGSNHVAILTDNNRVWVRGKNDLGQLGNPKFNQKNWFEVIIPKEKIINIKACDDLTVIMTLKHVPGKTAVQKIYACGQIGDSEYAKEGIISQLRCVGIFNYPSKVKIGSEAIVVIETDTVTGAQIVNFMGTNKSSRKGLHFPKPDGWSYVIPTWKDSIKDIKIYPDATIVWTETDEADYIYGAGSGADGKFGTRISTKSNGEFQLLFQNGKQI